MYMYDTMHLTEFTLVFDLGLDRRNVRRLQGTNAIHPSMLRKIYRMAIALPQLVLVQGGSISAAMHNGYISLFDRILPTLHHRHAFHNWQGDPSIPRQR